MIGYVIVGSRDLPKATSFYDEIMPIIGLMRVETSDEYVAYAPKDKPEAVEFYIAKPFDGKPATIGNGSMIAFHVPTRETVELFHKTALACGGQDEGAPGCRPADAAEYYAYSRDMDGNKICVFCAK